MNKREQYLNKLINFKDKPLIKVITGIRRCGKSTILLLFEEFLLKNGVKENQIIRMNFESFEYNDITEDKELHNYIKEKITNSNQKYYLLLDEIQQVKSWEKVINSFLLDSNFDIYITGSNAYLLSSELSTLLAGRYVEIKMLPLSFKEYLDFLKIEKNENMELIFDQYLKFGSLPTIINLIDNIETIPLFLDGIYNTVLLKDVIERNSVRDASLLENLFKFIAVNVGNIVSTKKISDYLTSNARKTSSETIDNYIKMLESAFIIYKANRFDLKGKMFLKTLEKYYIVDMGIRNHITGLRNTDYGHVLENIVYLELLRRGYEVYIGKTGLYEIDFVAIKPDEKIYYQVSASILDEKTRERELRPFYSIADNYPKVILTMDKNIFNDFSGIKVINIIDFLLEGK